MSKFIKNQTVQIQYPGKQRQKQIMHITGKKLFVDGITYWYVKQRICAIPEMILKHYKQNSNETIS
jgi:hypothetical protein